MGGILTHSHPRNPEKNKAPGANFLRSRKLLFFFRKSSFGKRVLHYPFFRGIMERDFSREPIFFIQTRLTVNNLIVAKKISFFFIRKVWK